MIVAECLIDAVIRTASTRSTRSIDKLHQDYTRDDRSAHIFPIRPAETLMTAAVRLSALPSR